MSTFPRGVALDVLPALPTAVNNATLLSNGAPSDYSYWEGWDAGSFAEQVAAAASPIDDVRGTARYRRHALQVLAARALKRVLA